MHIGSGTLGTKAQFTCDRKVGAALITKHRAIELHASAKKFMEAYFIKNYHLFVQFVEDKWIECEPHEICLVVGTHLTGDWATSVVNVGTVNIDFTFTLANVPGAPTAGLTIWGEWSRSICAPGRCGPSRRSGDANVVEPDLNQCIFFRGIRGVRRTLYETLKQALKVSSDDDVLHGFRKLCTTRVEETSGNKVAH